MVERDAVPTFASMLADWDSWSWDKGRKGTGGLGEGGNAYQYMRGEWLWSVSTEQMPDFGECNRIVILLNKNSRIKVCLFRPLMFCLGSISIWELKRTVPAVLNSLKSCRSSLGMCNMNFPILKARTQRKVAKGPWLLTENYLLS